MTLLRSSAFRIVLGLDRVYPTELAIVTIISRSVSWVMDSAGLFQTCDHPGFPEIGSCCPVAVTIGANVVIVREAVPGTTTTDPLTVTVGANVERLKLAVPGTTTLWSEAVTTGAKVVRVNAAVDGVTLWLLEIATVGANVVSVREAVDGVTT